MSGEVAGEDKNAGSKTVCDSLPYMLLLLNYSPPAMPPRGNRHSSRPPSSLALLDTVEKSSGVHYKSAVHPLYSITYKGIIVRPNSGS